MLTLSQIGQTNAAPANILLVEIPLVIGPLTHLTEEGSEKQSLCPYFSSQIL